MSSSKSSQQTNQTDNRRVLGEGAISAESGATVQVLDNGAINRAFDFSETVGTKALEFGLASQQASAKVISDAYQEAKGRGVLTDWITIGAIAMAGLVAIQVARR